MIKVKYLGKTPEYLEDFPKGCKRSVQGALHLMRNRLRKVTQAELDHIKDAHPDVYRLLKVMPMHDEKKCKMGKPKKKEKAPESETKDVANETKDNAKPDKGKKKLKPKK